MLRAGSQRLHPTGGGFNGHPPLGVNATVVADRRERGALDKFQRAPTLGGECYETDDTDLGFGWYNGFNGHPPLGVNATVGTGYVVCPHCDDVSTGTHPWG